MKLIKPPYFSPVDWKQGISLGYFRSLRQLISLVMEHFIMFTLVIAAKSFLVKSSLFQYHLATEKWSLIIRRHFSFRSNFHA